MLESKAKVTEQDVEILREYVALLERAKELERHAPTEEEMNALAGYVQDLKSAEELPCPSEEEMNTVGNYVANLKLAEELPTPTDEEMSTLAAHVGNLEKVGEAE